MSETKYHTKKRGGPRPGSGAPRKNKNAVRESRARIKVSITLPAEALEILRHFMKMESLTASMVIQRILEERATGKFWGMLEETK